MFTKRLKELIDETKLSIEEVSNGLELNDSSIIYRWLNGIHFPSLATATIIANYFQCSLDYLFGNSDDYKLVKAQEMKPFGTQLREMLKQKKISQQNIIKNLHISPTSITKWLKNMTVPNMTSVIKLANHLDVSIDYLVGRD